MKVLAKSNGKMAKCTPLILRGDPIVVTNHPCRDYQKIINNSRSLVDSRNALRDFEISCPIERL